MPWVELELEDDFEDEEGVGEEVVLTLVVLLEAVHGLVGMAMVMT
jgi:hypothetical protein